MLKISEHKDFFQVRELWQRHWPQECLFDLWPVRACFQSQFNHSPHFIVASQNGQFQGMLALSWIDEEQCFGHFPGELWQGKTWLEQNRVLAGQPEVFNALLDHIPLAFKIRYLSPDSFPATGSSASVDEVGYLFYPSQYGYSFQEYLQCFSGKSRKKIRRELDCLQKPGVCYRYDQPADIDIMFRMNLDNFGDQSYFADARFLKSFERLFAWLHDNHLLRVTTVQIGGRVAAVDVGAVWNSRYVVLAGGTDSDFPGVAKLINFHHIEWACHQRLSEVDFLCGDFNWKNRFHLSPRPLYQISQRQEIEDWPADFIEQRAACAA